MAKAKASEDLCLTESDPAAVVKEFIVAMHEWELSAATAYEAAKAAGKPPSFDQFIAGHEAVFAKFCTPKARPYGRNGSFSMPPEYQPEHELILEVVVESPRRAVVQTQQGTGFCHRRMYVLVRKSGRWLLDSVKWKRLNGKWCNCRL